MPVDSSIPLSVNQYQAPDLMGNAVQAFKLKEAIKSSKDEDQARAERGQLKDLYSQGGYGKEGFEQKLGAISPELVPQYQKTLLEAQQAQAKIGETQALEQKHAYETHKAKLHDFLEAIDPVNTTYQQSLKKFPPEQAAQMAEVEYQKQLMLAKNERDSRGNPLYSPQEIAQLPQHFEPRLFEQTHLQLLGAKAQMEQADKERDFKLKQDEFNDKKRHESVVEKNMGTGFTPQLGELLSAFAERGVSLPTGLRSKAQQVATLNGLIERNPGMTPDEIADKVKSGQLAFGASKTEASVLGRREAAILPVEKSIIKPGGFLDQAEKAVNDVDLPKLKAAGAFETWGKDQESDPQLTTYKAAIAELRAEYALVLSKGGQVTDAARHESAKVIPDLITKEQFKSVRKIVTQGIEASKSGVEESLSGVTGNSRKSEDNDPLGLHQ